jgi:hypothetical protein
MTGGADDAGKILGAYIKPYANAFGYNMTAGWYNTAKVHSFLGFDITLTANITFVPTEDKSFDVKALGLSSNASVGTPSVAPTIAGDNNYGPAITYTTNGHKIISYNTPKGTNLGFIPLPMLQAGLGLIKGTVIIGRFMPSISIGSGGESKIGLWGIGLEHSIKQWIPAVDDIPFLNLSIIGGYSRLHMVSNINLDPTGSLYTDNFIFPTDTVKNMNFSDQKMDLLVTSFTANAIVSIDIPLITVYAGLGISSTSSDLKLLGNYAIPQHYNVPQSRVDIFVSDVKKDPVSIAFKGGTKPRLNIGAKIKMGVVHLHFDYTYANYSIATVGLGVSFR